MEYFYDHSSRWNALKNKCNISNDDKERQALFYILSSELLYKKVNSIYDLEKNIIIENVFETKKVFFSSSEKAMIRLAFNLYNPKNKADVSKTFCNLDKGNFDICLKAISIKFG